MNKLALDIYRWVDERLALTEIFSKLFSYPIPGGARWSYVFGSALLFVFATQAFTGVFLTMYYVPSVETAHTTVAYIQKVVPGGAFIRGLHYWGSSMMVVLIGLHMLQVFFWGAYKSPREMVWILGGVLMLLVFGFAFTGYLLPWDQKAYFVTSWGMNIVSEVPVMGGLLKAVALGGSRLSTITLSRFYTIHSVLLPAITALFILLHLLAFCKAGAAGPFQRDQTRAHRVDFFFPRQFFYDTIFCAVVFVILAALAAGYPAVLERKANPSDAAYLPRPDWYFLPLFQLLKIFQGEWMVVGAVIIPVVLFALLFLVPFLDRGSERNPLRRPIASVSMIIFLVMLGTSLFFVKRDDGAFLSAADIRRLMTTPPEQIHQLSAADKARREAAMARVALDRQAVLAREFLAVEFQPYVSGAAAAPRKKTIPAPPPAYSQCVECHGDVGGNNGLIAPDLVDVGEKYNKQQLLQLLVNPEIFNISGMAPFGNDKMTAAEREGLANYLLSLRK